MLLWGLNQVRQVTAWSVNTHPSQVLGLIPEKAERAAQQQLFAGDSHYPGNVQGADWNGQVKLGNGQFVGVNYLQSVTPNLALGGEAFWLGQQRKSGAGFAARYADKEHVATAQVATTGLVSLAYLRRLSEKVRPAATLPLTILSLCGHVVSLGLCSLSCERMLMATMQFPETQT